MENLSMYSKLILGLCFTVLMACGSESEKSKIWYIEDSDAYIQIFESGATRKYICSVNNGYQQDTLFNGHLTANDLNLEWLNKTYHYQFLDKNSAAQFVSEDETIDLIAAENIPDHCFNNAVSITSFSPDLILVEGQSNISISFDFRSLKDTDIQIYFGNADSDGESMNTSLYSDYVNEGAVSSDVLQTRFFPSIEEIGSDAKVGIFMHAEVEGRASKLIAYDVINVETSGFSHTSASNSLNTDCLTCVYSHFVVPSPFN